MAQTVTMPKLGFDMAEGTLVRWVVPEGQDVKKGAVLAEIETDKATVEVESTFEGIVNRHLVKEGEVVPVGEPIAIIAAPGEKAEDQTTVPEKVILEEPRMVSKIAEKGQPAREVERLGGEVRPGPAPALEAEFPGGLRASPVARRMAEENGVDLRQIRGTGPDGRIVKKDIEAHLQKPQPATQPAPAPEPAEKKIAPQPAPIFAPAGPPPPDKEIPLNRLRGAIGRRMVESKVTVPHFYVTHEYDMAGMMELRKQINALLGEEEKASVNDFIVKAVALVLRQFPNLNATFQGDKIIQRGQVNIGVAVAVENGLLTVVCKDADRKPIRQISAEVRAMAGRARQGKVRPDDIEGSTFSISNLGMFGVEDFIAIINPPEAAILAIGAVREVPVVVNGEIKPGTRMKATISVDHRVSDGAEAARFLQALAPYLEEPMRLLL